MTYFILTSVLPGFLGGPMRFSVIFLVALPAAIG